jgi:mono/diheme cytochrome c family protein
MSSQNRKLQMSKKKIVLGVTAVVLLGALYGVFHMPSVGDADLPTGPEAIARGKYVFNAGGCGACHQPEGTSAPVGGYQIKVKEPFPSTFHVPNITPDPETGIGGWTGKDFLRALKHGRKPSGGFYFPAFPYRSYKDMTDQDVLDVGAYLMSLPPVKHAVPEHEVPAWQFSWMMAGWNIMASMMEGKEPAIPADNAQIQRGAYLARALGHCGECHTPRNGLGMMQRSREFAGVKDLAPDIDAAGVGWWSPDDFVAFLQVGVTAENEYVGGEMEDVIAHTALLTEEDQRAYAAFFTRGKASGSTSP